MFWEVYVYSNIFIAVAIPQIAVNCDGALAQASWGRLAMLFRWRVMSCRVWNTHPSAVDTFTVSRLSSEMSGSGWRKQPVCSPRQAPYVERMARKRDGCTMHYYIIYVLSIRLFFTCWIFITLYQHIGVINGFKYFIEFSLSQHLPFAVHRHTINLVYYGVWMFMCVSVCATTSL